MEAVGNKFVYDGVPGARTSGTTAPTVSWEFARARHLEPSLTDSDSANAGVQDAALFKAADGGQTWNELPGLRGHGSGPHWTARRRVGLPAHDPCSTR